MKLELADTVRLETTPLDDRRITRLYVGDREIPHDDELRRAVASLCTGEPLGRRQLEALAQSGVLQQADNRAPPHGALALRPGVAIDLELARRPAPGGGVGPAQSLALDLFVPPEVLQPLQALAGELLGAWLHMLRAAQGRGQAVDPAGASAVLAALAREWLARDRDLGFLLEIVQEEPLLLRPRAPLQAAAIQYPVVALRIASDRDLALASRTLRVPLGGPEHLAAVGTALGMVARGVAGDEALARLGPEATLVRDLLARLWTSELLVESPACRALDSSGVGDGEIVHLGHASLLARLGGDLVLFDPWFVPASAADATRPPTPSDLPRPAAVFFTHHHWDHLDPETLLKLDKDVPVYVPVQPPGLALAPRSAELLRALGFTAVRALPHGASVAFDGGQVVAAPFTGEDPTRLGWAGNCYVVKHAAGAALVAADNGPDADGRSLALEPTLVGRRLSPVFASRRQERTAMVEHGWSFLLRPSDEWTLPAENTANDAAYLAGLAAATRTSELVLYAEGGADWYPQGTDFLRGAHPSARDLARTWLWDSLDRIADEVPAAVTLAAPGARWTIGR